MYTDEAEQAASRNRLRREDSLKLAADATGVITIGYQTSGCGGFDTMTIEKLMEGVPESFIRAIKYLLRFTGKADQEGYQMFDEFMTSARTTFPRAKFTQGHRILAIMNKMNLADVLCKYGQTSKNRRIHWSKASWVKPRC